MTTFNDLMGQAAEAGFSGLLPDGQYQMEVADATSKTSNGGKQQVNIKLRVISGPMAGQSTWMNQSLTTDNPTALAIFFRYMATLGVDQAFFASLPGLELAPVAARIKQVNAGRVLSVKIGNRNWGTNNDKHDNTFEFQETVPAQPQPQPQPVYQPQPQPQPQPVYQPQPQPQPVYQPQPQPQPQPVYQPQQAPIDPMTGLPPRPGQGI